MENLEWVTSGENNKHAYDHLGKKGAWTGKFGKDHHSSTPIIQFTKEGGFVAEHESMQAAARSTGVSVSGISMCCNGTNKSMRGFIWKLA